MLSRAIRFVDWVNLDVMTVLDDVVMFGELGIWGN